METWVRLCIPHTILSHKLPRCYYCYYVIFHSLLGFFYFCNVIIFVTGLFFHFLLVLYNDHETFLILILYVDSLFTYTKNKMYKTYFIWYWNLKCKFQVLLKFHVAVCKYQSFTWFMYMLLFIILLLKRYSYFTTPAWLCSVGFLQVRDSSNNINQKKMPEFNKKNQTLGFNNKQKIEFQFVTKFCPVLIKSFLSKPSSRINQ